MITPLFSGCPQARADPQVELSGATGFGVLAHGNEVVPDVEMNGALMGKATIYICLFSDVWTWVDPA